MIGLVCPAWSLYMHAVHAPHFNDLMNVVAVRFPCLNAALGCLKREFIGDWHTPCVEILDSITSIQLYLETHCLALFVLVCFIAMNRKCLAGCKHLVDPASSHMLVSKIKPCMSLCKLLDGETVNGSLKQL